MKPINPHIKPSDILAWPCPSPLLAPGVQSNYTSTKWHFDKTTGEFVSKNELKRRQSKRERDTKRAVREFNKGIDRLKAALDQDLRESHPGEGEEEEGEGEEER